MLPCTAVQGSVLFPAMLPTEATVAMPAAHDPRHAGVMGDALRVPLVSRPQGWCLSGSTGVGSWLSGPHSGRDHVVHLADMACR